jgi:hypothetical protein
VDRNRDIDGRQEVLEEVDEGEKKEEGMSEEREIRIARL